VEERIKGLETGADDYLVKPFNINELQVRVNNLIDQRKKLKERYEKELKIPRSELRVISKDEKFLERAGNAVEKNIANSHFSVEDFQKEMGMSRMQLHRKLKALSEKSTSEFIRLIRMKKAAEMILNNQGTISEIAYEVGFNDPSYFTKCFRNEFGIPPSEYKDYMNGLK
jgi:AraC-like DNA-binding protein